LGTLPLAAHDFWIEAEPFTADAGSSVDIHLRIGEQLGGDSLPWVPNWYSKTGILGPDDELVPSADWPGLTGDVPAGRLAVNSEGVHIIALQTYRDFVELDAIKFNAYLRKEGLERVLKIRETEGLSNTPGTEFYTRCAKALINAGTAVESDPAEIAHQFGLTLELIPLANPYTLATGESLSVQLLYQSEPIEGITLIAFNDADPEERQAIVTDAMGMATVDLNTAGVWLLQAIHMLPVEEPSRADWESYWASLTFELQSN